MKSSRTSRSLRHWGLGELTLLTTTISSSYGDVLATATPVANRC